ncbi:MAG TPA: L-threonylcarbamoyladenylate synthase [Pyrinomonadaceae bacterium]|nr:L-threonylcarbamoyladenylate synthase [Pyrinomonadaceae bacterium]
MKTLFTRDPTEAAEFIKLGGVVAFPTETVYGLGANVFDAVAVAKIFEAKQRPADNPLILHVSRIEQISELAAEITESARRLIAAFFPGPLTVVLKRSDHVPLIATAGLDTVGIRMPRLSLANRFLEASEVPIAAPSANLSGRPSPTTWQAVAEDLDGRVDCILQGESTEIGLESTVVDCTAETPVVLRAGSVSIELLRQVVAGITANTTDIDAIKRSPGTRHSHYKPEAQVCLIEHPDAIESAAGSAYIGLAEPRVPFDYKLVCSDVDEYARSLFEFLRECDRRGIHTIYCQEVFEAGIGTALMDRLRRSAD